MDLERYFERCMAETSRDPRQALELVLRALDLVDEAAGVLGDQYADYRLRSLGLLASALFLAGNRSAAGFVFDGCSGIVASSSERGSLLMRESLYELYGSNWGKARDLADDSVAVFRTARSLRDDCSLCAALATRGMVELLAFQDGIPGFERDRCLDFYCESLAVSCADYGMSRLAAVSGLGRVLVSSWMGVGAPSATDVGLLVRLLAGFREDLRRQGTPYRSLLDANLRWLLALSLHRLTGGLGLAASKHFQDARAHLMEIGTESDVRWITLDYQWCLIADGEFGRALAECAFLPGMPPVQLEIWRRAIKGKLVTNRIAERVFRTGRASRGVLSPQGDALPGPGWDRMGIACGGRRGSGEFGF